MPVERPPCVGRELAPFRIDLDQSRRSTAAKRRSAMGSRAAGVTYLLDRTGTAGTGPRRSRRHAPQCAASAGANRRHRPGPRQRTVGHAPQPAAPAGHRALAPVHASDPSCRGVLCYIIRMIVAVPDAGSPAPTGGGTHPVNHCQQREYQRIFDHCAGLIRARPCARLPPLCVTLTRHPEHAYGPSTSCSTGAGVSLPAAHGRGRRHQGDRENNHRG